MSDPDSAGRNFEVTPGDVTIDSEGKVEIVNARLVEMLKEAFRLQKEQGGVSLSLGVNNWGCPLNYRCGKDAK